MAEYKYYFRYGFLESWDETPLYILGASSSLEFEDIEEHSEINSVYVSWEGSDDTLADGTENHPYRTIQYAKDMLFSDQYIITILDSNYYYTGDYLDLFFDLDGIVLQGVEGQKPVLRIDTNLSNQILMTRIQNGGKLINVEIQIDSSYTGQVTGIDAIDGTIKNVIIDASNRYGLQKNSSGTVNVYNTIIKNSINDGEIDGNGIYMSEGELNLDHCLIYGNDHSGIFCTGSENKTVSLDHCTISNNQYGIHTINSSNLSLTILNSIIYRNNIYDLYGSDGDISYTCIGKIQGSPTLQTENVVLRINPLFISYEDFRLRSKYNGFGDDLLLSPCLNVSDVGGDLGAYEYSRVLVNQSYIEFDISVPISLSYDKVPVDSTFLTTNTLKCKMIVKGFLNKLSLSWSGEDNALTNLEKLSLEDMFESEGDIYLSTDNQISYKQYIIDKSKGLHFEKALNTLGNTLKLNCSLELYEV
jgi:hypothetical protein